MASGDKLLLRNGFDIKGNKTGKKVQILSKRQKRKINSRPYRQMRKSAEKSPAEKRIAKFLAENGIKFISEHSFHSCYNRTTNQILYFDFFLPDYNAVIEFDGLHHYKPIYGEKIFRRQKENDGIKNRYCYSRGFPLLRIPCFNSQNIETIICQWFDKLF